MDTPQQNNEPAKKAAPAAAKKAPAKLPSKQISFSNQPVGKGGKQAKTNIAKGKKGGVNLMRKLSGM